MTLNLVRITSFSPDVISNPRWVRGDSWLWLLRAKLGSYARKANDYGWYSVLDGAGVCHPQGIWLESGHMVTWDHDYRYVSSRFLTVVGS